LDVISKSKGRSKQQTEQTLSFPDTLIQAECDNGDFTVAMMKRKRRGLADEQSKELHDELIQSGDEAIIRAESEKQAIPREHNESRNESIDEIEASESEEQQRKSDQESEEKYEELKKDQPRKSNAYRASLTVEKTQLKNELADLRLVRPEEANIQGNKQIEEELISESESESKQTEQAPYLSIEAGCDSRDFTDTMMQRERKEIADEQSQELQDELMEAIEEAVVRAESEKEAIPREFIYLFIYNLFIKFQLNIKRYR
jgi:hypothetical protein